MRQNRNSCKACHSLDLHGTALSRAKADRTLARSISLGGVVSITAGTPVDCYACHTTIKFGDISALVNLLLNDE